VRTSLRESRGRRKRARESATESPARASRHVLPAVDLDDLAGDVARQRVRREVDERAGALVGGAEAPIGIVPLNVSSICGVE
jgi:hypothetical protein